MEGLEAVPAANQEMSGRPPSHHIRLRRNRTVATTLLLALATACTSPNSPSGAAGSVSRYPAMAVFLAAVGAKRVGPTPFDQNQAGRAAPQAVAPQVAAATAASISTPETKPEVDPRDAEHDARASNEPSADGMNPVVPRDLSANQAMVTYNAIPANPSSDKPFEGLSKDGNSSGGAGSSGHSEAPKAEEPPPVRDATYAQLEGSWELPCTVFARDEQGKATFAVKAILSFNTVHDDQMNRDEYKTQTVSQRFSDEKCEAPLALADGSGNTEMNAGTYVISDEEAQGEGQEGVKWINFTYLKNDQVVSYQENIFRLAGTAANELRMGKITNPGMRPTEIDSRLVYHKLNK